MKKRLVLQTRDPSLRRELEAALPAGCSLVEKPRGDGRRIVFVDLDTVSLSVLADIAANDMVVAVTGRRETALLMEAVTRGACEVLHRPLKKSSVARILSDIACLIDELVDVIELGPAHPAPTCAIVGDSSGVAEMCKRLARLSQVDVPVLITGETGTGKELIAESIAQYSNRFGKPFVVINCASVPETLLESELFGYEKGAFSGATSAKPGLLRVADSGTVFLDEVGELPLPLQAKLLRFLQTHSFYPVGSTAEVQVDVRVLSASNRDIPAMVRKGTFREDLFHRLCVSSVAVPPLRDRTVDILPLVRFFIERYRHTAPRPIRGISRAFLDELLAHAWPGNIRELENVIRSAMAIVRTDYFTTFELRELDRGMTAEPDATSAEAFADASAQRLRQMLSLGTEAPYRRIHEELDRVLLEQALAGARENQSEAARLLGISRLTLRKKLGYG